jgi:hypothetical protein
MGEEETAVRPDQYEATQVGITLPISLLVANPVGCSQIILAVALGPRHPLIFTSFSVKNGAPTKNCSISCFSRSGKPLVYSLSYVQPDVPIQTRCSTRHVQLHPDQVRRALCDPTRQQRPFKPEARDNRDATGLSQTRRREPAGGHADRTQPGRLRC